MGIKFTKFESIYNSIFSENKYNVENINLNKDTILIHCGDVPLVLNKNIFLNND